MTENPTLPIEMENETEEMEIIKKGSEIEISSKNDDKKLSIVIIDDEKQYLISASKQLSELNDTISIVNKFQITKNNAEEMTETVIAFLKEKRGHIHAVLTDLNMPSRKIGIELLSRIRELENHPFTLVLSSGNDGEDLRGKSDGFVMKEKSILETIPKWIPKIRAFNERRAEREIAVKQVVEVKTQFPVARLSPLPKIDIKAIKKNSDNYNLLDDESGLTYWISMLDFDNTLYQTKSKHSILLHSFATFLKKESKHDFKKDGGDIGALNQLIEYCDEWSRERHKVANGRHVPNLIEYEDGLTKSANLSALAFEGMNIELLRKYGKTFINEHLEGDYFEYVSDVIENILEHGIMPVISTGAPNFLLQAILERLGLSYGNGMTYEMKEGIITGEIAINMGLSENKGNLGMEYKKKGHAIVSGGGDSEGDVGSAKMATCKSHHAQDVFGTFVFVNASDRVKAEIKRNYNTEIKDGSVIVVENNMEPETAFNNVLMKLFEPSHYFVRRNESSSRKRKFIKKMRELEKEEKKSCVIKNIQSIIKIWQSRGADNYQITQILAKSYPISLVNNAMKLSVVDTAKGELAPHLDKVSNYYESLSNEDQEVSTMELREAIAIVLAANQHYSDHQKKLTKQHEQSTTSSSDAELSAYDSTIEQVKIFSEISSLRQKK